MKQNRLYFAGAGLFALATGLNLFNQGVNFKTGIGLVLAGALLALGLKMRRAGN